jgi:hypothetical protein
MPDFEGRERPAIAEDFRGFAPRAGPTCSPPPAPSPARSTSIDPHQKKAHQTRARVDHRDI